MQILKIELQLTWFIPTGGLSEGDGLLFTFLLPCFCCGLPYRCSLPTAAPSLPTRKALHTYLEELPDLAGLLCFFQIELDVHPFSQINWTKFQTELDKQPISGWTSGSSWRAIHWIEIRFYSEVTGQSGSIRKFIRVFFYSVQYL